jgi:hypothetical protein
VPRALGLGDPELEALGGELLDTQQAEVPPRVGGTQIREPRTGVVDRGTKMAPFPAIRLRSADLRQPLELAHRQFPADNDSACRKSG